MKRIFSIILVMALVLTMTACVNSDAQPSTSEEKIIETVVEQIPTEARTPTHEEEVFIETPLYLPIIEEMDEVEIAEYLSELIRISKEKILSPYQIESVSYNVYYLYEFNTTEYDVEAQIHEVFHNMATQARNLGLALTSFRSWSSLPITNILCEYFSISSSYFDYTVDCSALDSLSEEDVLKISTVFFENPVFAYNTAFACDVISKTSCDEAIEMAWKHIQTLSESSSPELAENTYWICHPIFINKKMYDPDKIFEVCKNILANSSYDFVDKYTTILCASFYCSINGNDVADKVFNFVFEDLLKLAQSADQDTYNQISDVITKLYDEYYFLDSQEIEDLHEKYDVRLLKKYLTNWKESINAQYRSNY